MSKVNSCRSHSVDGHIYNNSNKAIKAFHALMNQSLYIIIYTLFCTSLYIYIYKSLQYHVRGLRDFDAVCTSCVYAQETVYCLHKLRI